MSPSGRRNSYTAEFKLKVVEEAEDIGNRAAALTNQVDESLVRRWRLNKPVLQSLNPQRKSLRGRQALWPELEQCLKKWALNGSGRLTRIEVQTQALKIADQLNIEKFCGGPKWCHNFMRRNNLLNDKMVIDGRKLRKLNSKQFEKFESFHPQPPEDIEPDYDITKWLQIELVELS